MFASPELVHVNEFMIMGLKTRTKNEDELNPQTAKLHILWAQFFKTDLPKSQPESSIYGVYSEYESDYCGFYSVTAGITMNLQEHPSHEQFNLTQVQKGKYLVFKNSGPIPDVIYATWEMVWDYFKKNPHILRAYKTDFEVCPQPNQCEVYIGISG